MTRKRLLLGLTVLSCLILTGLVVCIVVTPDTNRPGVTRENYEKIKVGMTRAEVEQLMGGPSGWYVTQPNSPWNTTTVRMGDGSWIGDEGQVEVWYDEEGKVRDKRFVETRSLESWADKVRRGIGL